MKSELIYRGAESQPSSSNQKNLRFWFTRLDDAGNLIEEGYGYFSGVDQGEPAESDNQDSQELQEDAEVIQLGGKGSGHFGHAGIPGHHGGSLPAGGSLPSSAKPDFEIFDFGSLTISGPYSATYYPGSLTIFKQVSPFGEDLVDYPITVEQAYQSYLKAPLPLRANTSTVVINSSECPWNKLIGEEVGIEVSIGGVADGGVVALFNHAQAARQLILSLGPSSSFSLSVPSAEETIWHEMAHNYDAVVKIEGGKASQTFAWIEAVMADASADHSTLLSPVWSTMQVSDGRALAEEFAETVSWAISRDQKGMLPPPSGEGEKETYYPQAHKVKVLRKLGVI